MFTYVGLAYCCIVTEVSLNNEDRLKATQATTLATLTGPLTIFILQQSSNQLENFKTFQIICVIIAVISCLLMRYCGKHCYTERELVSQGVHDLHKNDQKQDSSILTITKQILFNRDFLSFVIVNFFQGFHRSFVNGFFTIFCDQLILKGTIPDVVRSIFYAAGPIISKLCVLFGAPLIRRWGYFSVIWYSYILKIVIGSVYLLTGPINYWVLILFMVTDRHRVTSMIYGTNALVVKPAQSLSPMLVVAFLNRYGYEQMKEHKLDPTQLGTLNGAMFSLLCLFPLILGTIQSITWSFYTIRHKKTIDITMLINDVNELNST